MLESISSSDLEVGNSYVETYYTGYTLFTVIERTFINPTDVQYSIEKTTTFQTVTDLPTEFILAMIFLLMLSTLCRLT